MPELASDGDTDTVWSLGVGESHMARGTWDHHQEEPCAGLVRILLLRRCSGKTRRPKNRHLALQKAPKNTHWDRATKAYTGDWGHLRHLVALGTSEADTSNLDRFTKPARMETAQAPQASCPPAWLAS